MNFIAIDFETANYKRTSACSVGLVLVDDRKIVDEYSSLIRPNDDFVRRFIDIHGISPSKVKNAPTFAEAWPAIKAFIGKGPLIAHNASFDMGVLRACINFAGFDIPAMEYACTSQGTSQTAVLVR